MSGKPRIWSALVHYPVLDRDGRVVSTSVANTDVHDMARASKTYGIENFFIVTPIDIHREMVTRVVSIWHKPAYGGRIPARLEAMKLVRVAATIGEAARMIEKETGERPDTIAEAPGRSGQAVSWKTVRQKIHESPDRPRLIMFGTGWGLAPQALEACTVRLEPSAEEDEYPVLSVRCRAAVILDRLLGHRQGLV